MLPYLDLPIQHCNDEILHNMNRRSTRQELLDVIARLRAAIPGITLRTTLIAGFPGETEAPVRGAVRVRQGGAVRPAGLLCLFGGGEHPGRLDGRPDRRGDQKAPRRPHHGDPDRHHVRKQAGKVGQTLRVLCDGLDDESGLYICRTAADAPEIDGAVCVASEEPLYPGRFYDVHIEESDLYDLYGRLDEENTEGNA